MDGSQDIKSSGGDINRNSSLMLDKAQSADHLNLVEQVDETHGGLIGCFLILNMYKEVVNSPVFNL